MTSKKFFNRILIWTIIGSFPGIIMVLLTIPISGEVELTLGVNGIILAITGAVIGALIGLLKR